MKIVFPDSAILFLLQGDLKVAGHKPVNFQPVSLSAGLQILLFLSALQGIPFSAKEAAQMEGATAWEYFWKITIPYISPQILTCIVYTIVDSFVDPSNEVMKLVLNKQADWAYGYASAMAWIYFAIIGVVLAIVVAIINKFVYYEVE